MSTPQTITLPMRPKPPRVGSLWIDPGVLMELRLQSIRRRMPAKELATILVRDGLARLPALDDGGE